MPIPNKGFFDPDPDPEPTPEPTPESTPELPEPDSLRQQREERAALEARFAEQDREQAALNAKFKAEEDERRQKAHTTEIANLERYVGLARDQMTRDMLLERIRKMREDKPKEYEPPPLSQADKERLEREQKAGREALAMVQAKMGIIPTPTVPDATPVHHPNPSQDEIYPTIKSTLPPKPLR